MQTAILVKELSLAQEARIIRRLEKSRRQSAKWAREKQKAIELATAVKVGTVADFPVYHAKTFGELLRPPLKVDRKDAIKKYLVRINAKNHLVDIARKMVAGEIPDATKYRIGEMVATDDFLSLYNHRIKIVRPEARAAHLALGFLRGKSYVAMENKSYDWPNWTRIQEIITKYGDGDIRVLLQRFEQWKQEGEKRGLINDGELSGQVRKPKIAKPSEPLLTNHKGVLAGLKEFLGFAS